MLWWTLGLRNRTFNKQTIKWWKVKTHWVANGPFWTQLKTDPGDTICLKYAHIATALIIELMQRITTAFTRLISNVIIFFLVK